MCIRFNRLFLAFLILNLLHVNVESIIFHCYSEFVMFSREKGIESKIVYNWDRRRRKGWVFQIPRNCRIPSYLRRIPAATAPRIGRRSGWAPICNSSRIWCRNSTNRRSQECLKTHQISLHSNKWIQEWIKQMLLWIKGRVTYSTKLESAPNSRKELVGMEIAAHSPWDWGFARAASELARTDQREGEGQRRRRLGRWSEDDS